eukprot:11549249-Alexandrium_andersonii.AAC.1
MRARACCVCACVNACARLRACLHAPPLVQDEKIRFYGENRRAVGGRSDGDDGGGVDDNDDEMDDMPGETDKPTFSIPLVSSGRGKPGRDKVAVEPVAWHALPTDFYTEIVSSFYAKLVIDLTPGSGNFAIQALQKGVRLNAHLG